MIRPVYLIAPLEEVRAIYEFEIARELGRIRLGHTHWLHELLVAYIVKLPLLRNPLLHADTYAYDRYAAWLAPDSMRGLTVYASGRPLFKLIDLPAFIEQADSTRGFWPWMSNLTRSEPHVTFRLRALLDAGLFRRDSGAAAGSAAASIPRRASA